MPGSQLKLSVVLAVRNEEKTLGVCLDSVKHIADEIVIVDGESEDRTVEIAKQYGARVIETKNEQMFHINKQKALDAAKGQWILQLDADERVSKELAEQIHVVVNGGEVAIADPAKYRLFARHQHVVELRDGKIGTEKGEVVAYFVPRLNYFLGGWLRHGGVYPDGVIRLIHKGKAKFPLKSVHEQIEIDGRVGWLSGDLLHYSDPTFARYLWRADRYTTLTALAMKKDHVSKSAISTLHYMFLKPLGTFLSLYIRHKGILDGFPGFVWALFSGLHYPMAYMKYREMRNG